MGSHRLTVIASSLPKITGLYYAWGVVSSLFTKGRNCLFTYMARLPWEADWSRGPKSHQLHHQILLNLENSNTTIIPSEPYKSSYTGRFLRNPAFDPLLDSFGVIKVPTFFTKRIEFLNLFNKTIINISIKIIFRLSILFAIGNQRG